MGGDDEISLSTHESQDAKSGDHEPSDTKSHKSGNESDYFSAEEDVEVGDSSFQRANDPVLTARKSEFSEEVGEALKKLKGDQSKNSIITDEYFDVIVKFLLSLETAEDKKEFP